MDQEMLITNFSGTIKTLIKNKNPLLDLMKISKRLHLYIM